MPMKQGKGRKVISKNIAEFHGGKTYEKTKSKFGKETADKQAVAAAYAAARKSGDKEDATRGRSRSTGGTTSENEWHRPV